MWQAPCVGIRASDESKPIQAKATSMKLRSQTEWTTRQGKKRVVRLYKAWRNILGRVQGHNVNGQGVASWEGIGNEFNNWRHFREWSLASGFSRQRNSCDRVKSDKPYGPDNCRWVSVGDNTRNAHSTIELHRKIVAFQLSAPTEEETVEINEFDRLCLGVFV